MKVREIYTNTLFVSGLVCLVMGVGNWTVGVVETSKMLRHSQISTTQIYLERRQDAAFQAGRSAGWDV